MPSAMVTFVTSIRPSYVYVVKTKSSPVLTYIAVFYPVVVVKSPEQIISHTCIHLYRQSLMIANLASS